MRLREYIALFIVLVCILNWELRGQSLTVSIELNNPSNILANWENKTNSLRVNVNNKTRALLLANFYIEITNQDGAVANNSSISGEFIELRPGNNNLLADKLLPAFGINYIRGLPNAPLEGGNYEICVNIDISGNAIEGETAFKACNQWEVEQSASTVISPKVFSAGSLRSPQKGLEITQVQNRAIRFSWNPISPRPDIPVTYMLLVYAKPENKTNQEIIAEQTPILELPVVGKYNVSWPSSHPLLENGEYIWTIRPVNSVGESLLPPPGISEIRSFKIDCDIKKMLPKTRDGLFALDLPIPSTFSLLENQSQICWESLPLAGLSYQLNYEKAVCDSIISDGAPYPFSQFIPSNAEEELINQATQQVDKLDTELKAWQAFASKHAQRFVWTEQELEMWENVNNSLSQLSKSWPVVLDTLSGTQSCDRSEACCGENDCCKGLNPCFKSERELFLSRLICQEDQLDRLRHQQTKELVGLLGAFTRQYYSKEAVLLPTASDAYFQLYRSVIQLLAYFEDKNLRQHRAFSEVLNQYPSFRQQAPVLYQKILSAPTNYWQVLNDALVEAETNKKLLPSSLLAGLDEYLRHISPEMNEVMGKTRSGAPKSIQDYLENAYTNNQCLITFSSRKKEHLEACQNFSLQVAGCLENEKRKVITKKNGLVNEAIKLRTAYWESISDSIQVSFQQAARELGSKWRESICREGGKISLPGAQTQSAIDFKDALEKRLGRKLCYLNFTIEVDCNSPQKDVRLTHSYPLLRRNENCCNSQTDLSWQSKKIVGNELKEEICLSISASDIVETFNQQLSILNPRAQALQKEDIYAGRWSLTAFDDAGVMQAYSPSRVLELEVIQPNDLMLELRDTTNCGCNVKASMNGKTFSSSSRMLITQPGKVQKFSINGKCEGGCLAGPTYISITTPPLQQIVKGAVEPVVLPIVTFYERTFDYNFPQTGVYHIQIKQVCNGYVCTEAYEVEVRPTGKVESSLAEWMEETKEEKNAYCLSSFYKNEEDSTWNTVAFQNLSIREKSKIDFLVKSMCNENCETQSQYQWKLIDASGKEQIVEEKATQVNYHFKKAGNYQIILKENAPCASEEQFFREQIIHIKVLK